MVFVNTRREADRLSDALQRNGIEAEALSGDVPQRKRLRMLKDFQAGKLAVLIGTDVASRGLHVPGVSHVFNYDLPAGPRGLRAPHRPHRARGRRRRRDQLRLRDLRNLAARHRGVHRPQDPGLDLRSQRARAVHGARAASIGMRMAAARTIAHTAVAVGADIVAVVAAAIAVVAAAAVVGAAVAGGLVAAHVRAARRRANAALRRGPASRAGRIRISPDSLERQPPRVRRDELMDRVRPP